MKGIVFAHGASTTGHEHLSQLLEREFAKKGYRMRLLVGGFKRLENGEWDTVEFRSGVTPVRAGAGSVDTRKVDQHIRRLHGDFLICIADRIGVDTALVIEPKKPLLVIPCSIDGDIRHDVPYSLGFDTAAEEAARQISSLLTAKAGVWYTKPLAVVIRVMGGPKSVEHAERVWELFREIHGPTSHIALTRPLEVGAEPDLRAAADKARELLRLYMDKAAVGLLLPEATCDKLEGPSLTGKSKGQWILTNNLRTDANPQFAFSDPAEIRTAVLGVSLNRRDRLTAAEVVQSILTDGIPKTGVQIWHDGQGFIRC